MKAKTKTWARLSRKKRLNIINWMLTRANEWRYFGLAEVADHLTAAIAALSAPPKPRARPHKPARTRRRK